MVHLVLDLLSTVVIGSGLENGLGSWKLMTLYFVSSFGGIIFSCVFNPMSYSVGASTAIFGLIGYYVSHIYKIISNFLINYRSLTYALNGPDLESQIQCNVLH